MILLPYSAGVKVTVRYRSLVPLGPGWRSSMPSLAGWVCVTSAAGRFIPQPRRVRARQRCGKRLPVLVRFGADRHL